MNKSSSSTYDLFHLGAKALIQNAQGQLLLLRINPRRLTGNTHGHYWDLPGGRVERGEKIEDTLRREIIEETGFADARIRQPFAMVLSNIRIPLKTYDVGLVLSAYRCEVADTSALTISDEHTEYGWFSLAEAAELLKVKYPAEFIAKLPELA